MTGTVRILHTSDVHLGSDIVKSPYSGSAARTWLTAVVDLINEVEADLLIIAGDLFDSPRVPDSIVGLAVEQFKRAAIPVVLLPGNHDCLVAGSPYLRHNAFRGALNVRVIMNPEGERIELPDLDMAIWGRPHINYVDYSPMAGITERGPEKWQVALAHGYYVAKDNAGNWGWQITDEDLEASNMDYIALGHMETFSRAGRNGVAAYYSGSPRQTGAVALAELDSCAGVSVSQLSIPLVEGTEVSIVSKT